MFHHPTATFWLIFAVIFFLMAFCDVKYNMLRDISTSNPKPYSWSRVQLAWWTLIVLSAFITVVCCYSGHQIPTLDASTLVLLGITTGTTAAARLIDASDQANPNIPPSSLVQNGPKENFFLDIVSDNNGVSINRLQAVIFNLVFGVWFIGYVLEHFGNPCGAAIPPGYNCAAEPWSFIIPIISTNNLILLGLSSATYAALKTTENTAPVAGAATAIVPPPPPPPVPAQQPPIAAISPGPSTQAPPAATQPDPTTDASGNPVQPANG